MPLLVLLVHVQAVTGCKQAIAETVAVFVHSKDKKKFMVLVVESAEGTWPAHKCWTGNHAKFMYILLAT